MIPNNKKLFSRGNLIVPKLRDQATVGEWVQALIRDVQTSPLVEELPKAEAPKPDIKKLEERLAQTSKNPYVRARVEVLAKLKPSAIKEIERMEKEGKTGDRFYKEFAEQVRRLGDQYSA